MIRAHLESLYITGGSLLIGGIVMWVIDAMNAKTEAANQEASSRGEKWMVLETATTTSAAIALWKKYGCRATETIENYYGHAQNAFELQKRLELQAWVKVLS